MYKRAKKPYSTLLAVQTVASEPYVPLLYRIGLITPPSALNASCLVPLHKVKQSSNHITQVNNINNDNNSEEERNSKTSYNITHSSNKAVETEGKKIVNKMSDPNEPNSKNEVLSLFSDNHESGNLADLSHEEDNDVLKETSSSSSLSSAAATIRELREDDVETNNIGNDSNNSNDDNNDNDNMENEELTDNNELREPLLFT